MPPRQAAVCRHKCEETERFFNEKGVDVHWIIPFDDSSSEFSVAYVELVNRLKDVYRGRPLRLDISAFEGRFESDQYHLHYDSRRQVALLIRRYIEAVILKSGA